MILAVTHAGDEHARPVLEALARRGLEAVVLDLADLPARGSLALAYGREEALALRLDGRAPLDARQVTAVWWRRPLEPEPSAGLSPAHAAFAARQTLEAVMGLLQSLAPHALLVNDPWRDRAADLKTHQLAAARRAGLPVPETLVTNDPAAAHAFLAACGAEGAVHKAIHATQVDWRRTQRVGPGDLARLDDLRLSPVILQERVPGVDVRVTVVGDELFAAQIDARGSSSPDDFRGFEGQCRFAPCRLPDGIERGLRALVRDLGLAYAAVDFRRRDDGAWFFLELNPAGQWLFVEQRTNQPIAEAVATLLAAGRGR